MTIMHSRHYAGNTFLAGSKVLITDATTPLGRSCAFRFAELNCRLILLGPDEYKLRMLGEDLAKAAKEVPMSSGPKQLEFVKMDVNDAKQIKELVKHIASIDVLINLAGSLDDKAVWGQTTDLKEQLRLSYESAISFVSAFAPHMKTWGAGHIINVLVSSPDGKNLDLSSLRQSLSAYTIASRYELVNSPIRVTAVAPTQSESRNSQVPQLDTEDIADQVVFAATRAKHVQMADIMSDSTGGMQSKQPDQKGQAQVAQQQEMQNIQNRQEMSPNLSQHPPQLQCAKPQAPEVKAGTAPEINAGKQNGTNQVATPEKTLWDVEIAELKRRQKKEHGRDLRGDGTFKEEKHRPTLTVQNGVGKVVVGGVGEFPFHTMDVSENPDEMHYVTHIYVLDQYDRCVAMKHLDPVHEKKAEMTFAIPSCASKLKPYDFCNKHGLWDGPEVIVPQYHMTAKSLYAWQTNPNTWRYIISELHRMHKTFQKRTSPYFAEGTDIPWDVDKNSPNLSISGEKVSVIVGSESKGKLHPVIASTDPAEVHYITHIYVLNQDNDCVYLEALDPMNTETAQVEFDLRSVPSRATKLTPYSYCNLHGLWYGVSVNVPEQRRNPMEAIIPNGRTVSPNYRSYDQGNPQSPDNRSNQMGAMKMRDMMSPMALPGVPMHDQMNSGPNKPIGDWELIVHPDGLRVHQPVRNS